MPFPNFFFNVLLDLEAQQHHKKYSAYLEKKINIKSSRNRCLLNVSMLQSFRIKMPGISTLYLEGYFKYKYVQQGGENILHMEKKEDYIKGSKKKKKYICPTAISSHIL